MNHTPGPWQVAGQHEEHGAGGVILSVPKDKFIAGLSVAIYGEESKANARLIAAAPDLLAALERIAGFTYDGEKDEDGQEYEMSIDDAFATAHGAITLAREALAKIKEM